MIAHVREADSLAVAVERRGTWEWDWWTPDVGGGRRGTGGSQGCPQAHLWSLGDEDLIKHHRGYRKRGRFYFVPLDGGWA